MAQKFIFRDQPFHLPVKPWALFTGDAFQCLKMIPERRVNCWVTSPPYYRKIDYGVEGQCGLEPTVENYLAYQKRVAAEMLRASTPDATLFWVLQDSANCSGGTGGDYRQGSDYYIKTVRGARVPSWPRKSQLLIPEFTRIAFAQVGWVPILRIVWNKEDPRRGSDFRPSYSYEEILLFGASPDNYWDHDAVRTPLAQATLSQLSEPYDGEGNTNHYRESKQENPSDLKRRIISGMSEERGARVRAVWHIPSGSQPKYKDKQGIACFPEILSDICINLGCPVGGVVGDPYVGWGTTMLSAQKYGRQSIGIELNPERADIIAARLEDRLHDF